MTVAGVVRKEKRRKRNKDDPGCQEGASVEPRASDVAAAPAVAAAAAAPPPQPPKGTREATGTKQKEKKKQKKKEKKRKRKMAQVQEGEADNAAEDQSSRVPAAAGVSSSSTSTCTGRRTIVDGPDSSEGTNTLPADEGKQGEKPAKRRKKGRRAPSAATPSSPSSPSAASSPLSASHPTAKPLAKELPALLCTGKVNEYPPISVEQSARKPISGKQSARKPISGEQSARNGTGDRHGQSGSQGSPSSSSSAKKGKGRRSPSRGKGNELLLDGSDLLPGGGVASSERTDGGNSNTNDSDNNNANNHHDEVVGEDDPLEGVVHNGAMFLVDARRRVFSAQRDEQGDLVKVGRFDDSRGEVILETRLQTADGNTPEALPEAGVGVGVGALGVAAEALSKSPTSADIASGVLQAGGLAGGGGATVETEVVRDGKKKKKKNKKKKKTGTGVAGGDGVETGDGKESASGGALPGAAARDVVEYPFEVEECDHCETSELAYAHIAPLLAALASELGKAPEELVIYDPYFCQGSTVRRLASLGFPGVYNKNEDFYEAVKSGTVPEYDVLVTNPPFSGDHVPKILSFCARQGSKPWLLLMPNYVYLKDYYEPSLRSGPSSQGATLPFYLTPPKRYMYYSPQGSRVNVKSSERKTSPFNTFWYIRLGDGRVTSKILQAYDARSRKPGDEPKCCVARTTQQIPFKMMDSNDPRRKKARDRQRSIDRIRKKKSEWTANS